MMEATKNDLRRARSLLSGQFHWASHEELGRAAEAIALAFAEDRHKAEILLDGATGRNVADVDRIAELEALRAAEERINRDQHKALCRREETITKLTRERDEAAQERERWKDTAQKAANEALRRAPPSYPTDRTEPL